MLSHMVLLDRSYRNRIVEAESKHTAGRFQLDYATWWSRLAAPGSRFGATAPKPQTIRRAMLTYPVASVEAERRTA